MTYDDVESLANKCREVVVANELGGALLWALGYDAVGADNPPRQPLLSTVGRALL